MSPQDVGDGGVAIVVADVLQRCLNATLATCGILFGKANDGIHDFLSDARPAGAAFFAGPELLRDQFPVPTEKRVGCDDGCEFQPNFVANRVSFHGQ